MAQHNLVSFFLKHRVTICTGTIFSFGIYFTLQLYQQRTWKNVNADLKILVFEHFLQKHGTYTESGFDYSELKKLLGYKGDFVLTKNNCLDEISWSVEVGFDNSLLIWHDATDICFYSNPKKK